MRKKVTTWWQELIDVTTTEPEVQRLGRLFNILMLISLGIVIFLSLVFLSAEYLGLIHKSISIIAASFPLSFIPLSIFCLLYAKNGHVRSSIIIYVSINFLAINAAAWVFDGVKSPAWVLHVWTITIAGTLLAPHYALWMTGGTVFYYGSLFLLSQFGWYTPVYTFGADGREFIDLCFLIIMLISTVGFLTFLNMNSLRQTMDQLREEIIERTQVEKHLSESEERYRNVFDNARDIIYTVANDMRITSLNCAFEHVTGWSADEWLGKEFPPIIEPSDLPLAMDIFKKISDKETIDTFELRVLKKNGEYFFGEFTITLIHLGGEKFILGHVRDVTERKKIEASLKKSEDKYRKIFENVQDIFYQTDTTGIITEISPSIERYSGYQRNELIGMPVTDVYVNPEDRPKLLDILKTQSEVVDFEVQLKSKRGDTIFTSVNAHLRYGDAGIPIGVEGSLRDITERKKLEEERKRLITKLQESLDSIKTLSGLLPICASCKKIRDDKGYWNQLEAYLVKHSDAQFTHGLCPDCMEKYFPPHSTSPKQ